jgi:hypothetical protein
MRRRATQLVNVFRRALAHFGGVRVPSFDDVSFDTSAFTYVGEHSGVRVWWTPTGDPIGLYYFPIPPDIGADISDLEALWRFVRASGKTVGAVPISLDTVNITGGRVVRQIVKIPQEPSGRTYIGSVTIPFRDFSFVLKVEAREHGVTGFRDTTVCHEMIQAGTVVLDPDAGLMRGWTQDPYDPALRDGPYANLSDAEVYDARFPTHPLSRVRPLLRRLTASLCLSPAIRDFPPFVYPPVR